MLRVVLILFSEATSMLVEDVAVLDLRVKLAMVQLGVRLGIPLRRSSWRSCWRH